MAIKIPREVARHLGYYVYLYIDPRNTLPFYVGKGQNSRTLAHLSDDVECRKTAVLKDLASADLEPRLEILAHGLQDEETALRVEAAAIDLLQLGHLANRIRGWKSVQYGRMPLSELVIYYAAKPVVVRHPSLLIRINKLYHHGITSEALYEATRGIWKVGQRRETAKYAIAVFEGVVREVYSIESWHRAGTTQYTTRDISPNAHTGRWEFLGAEAPDPVRRRYVGRSVRSYLKRGMQSPVVYAGC